MNWFWLIIVPFVIGLLLVWFTKTNIDCAFDRAFMISSVILSLVPVLNWALIIALIISFAIGYEDITLKDTKLNRWLFESRFY